MKAWLAIGLLLVVFQAGPKQADKPHANQNGSKSLSEQPKQPARGATPNIPLPGPSTAPKEDGSKHETKQPSWREKLISPVVLNWPLIAVAIWGILVARSTLHAIEWQAQETANATQAMCQSIRLQEVALRQWVDIDNWASLPHVKEDGTRNLHVQFDIVNPTPHQMVFKAVTVVFNAKQVMLAEQTLLPPRQPHTVAWEIEATDDDFVKWQENRLLFHVAGHVNYQDALEVGRQQPFSGLVMFGKDGGTLHTYHGAGFYIGREKKKPES